MNTLEFTKKRLCIFLCELDNLAEIEFPYPHSKDALDVIRCEIQKSLSLVKQLKGDYSDAVVEEACAQSLRILHIYLPLLGFILRSTSVRNAFEVFRPLLRLFGDILEQDISLKERSTKLVLSSEWDYSPKVYQCSTLRDFVLIGLPSPESSNPLLLPLAGHELGHVIWEKQGLAKFVQQDINDEILSNIKSRWKEYQELYPSISKIEDLDSDLFAMETWALSVRMVIQQAEESFCDFIGVKVFGESFLYAFAYMVAPKFSGPRSLYYPNMKTRATNLVLACKQLDIEFPDSYPDLFGNSINPNNLTAADDFMLTIADAALTGIIERLITKAKNTIEPIGLPGSKNKVSFILDCYKKMIPAEGSESIINILNAAWAAYMDSNFWASEGFSSENRDHILKELVLKNFEILEIEQLTAGV